MAYRNSYYYRKKSKRKNNDPDLVDIAQFLIEGVFKIMGEVLKLTWKFDKFIFLKGKEIIRGYINGREISKAIGSDGFSYNTIMDMVYKDLNPRQFEIFTAEVYKALGHKVKLTPKGGDYGRDVIVDDNVFVECKHFKRSNKVGREICQKLLGSVHMFGAKKGIVFTTGGVHDNANEVVEMVDNLEIIDYNGILKMLKKISISDIRRILLISMNSD